MSKPEQWYYKKTNILDERKCNNLPQNNCKQNSRVHWNDHTADQVGYSPRIQG